MKNTAIVLSFACVVLFGAFIWSLNNGNAGRKDLVLDEVNLVSSVKDVAPILDDKLTDAWGLEFGHSGRIWINNNSGYSTVYDGQGNIVMTKDAYGQSVPLAVKIPSASNSADPAPLTGMIFSDKNSFSGDAFVFVTEEGIIAGWHKLANGVEPLVATVHVDHSVEGAVYKGVTAAETESGWYLYASNFSQNKVDVFDSNYQPVTLSDAFQDPKLPKDFAPFNAKAINGEIYVTYAKQGIDKANDVRGVGNGYIDVFDWEGKLLRRLASNGELNSPWGLALAPSDFGKLSNYLLVGNFGDGHILAYTKEGKYVGMVRGVDKEPFQIDGLWALTFGTDNGAGKSNELFFASGPSAEDQGLFGRLNLPQ